MIKQMAEGGQIIKKRLGERSDDKEKGREEEKINRRTEITKRGQRRNN